MSGATFTLHRHSDPSGVSGTGVVAEGWESSDGKTVVIKWLSATPSVCIYEDVRHVRALHGHGGATEIVWDTEHAPETPESNSPQPTAWEMHDDPEMNR